VHELHELPVFEYGDSGLVSGRVYYYLPAHA
jgi:hypothetical protein